MVQAIKKATLNKYSYGYKFAQNRIKNQKLLLPATKEGKPDYIFMEKYIKNIINKKQNKYIDFVKEKLKNLEKFEVNIDNVNWKEFKLNDIFEIKLSKGDNQADLLENGTFPLVSAGNNNNGICKYIKTGDGISNIFTSKSITIDMFGKVFFQPYNFYSVSHGRINILTSKHLYNEYVGLFFCNILENRFKGKYSFAVMCNKRRLEREKLLLPATKEGEPDYVFMEKYIKNIIFNKYNNYLRYIK